MWHVDRVDAAEAESYFGSEFVYYDSARVLHWVGGHRRNWLVRNDTGEVIVEFALDQQGHTVATSALFDGRDEWGRRRAMMDCLDDDLCESLGQGRPFRTEPDHMFENFTWTPPLQPRRPATVPPSWHNDPTGRYQYRWWDGSTWTSFVAQDGVQLVDPDSFAESWMSTASVAAHRFSGRRAKAIGAPSEIDAEVWLVMNQRAAPATSGRRAMGLRHPRLGIDTMERLVRGAPGEVIAERDVGVTEARFAVDVSCIGWPHLTARRAPQLTLIATSGHKWPGSSSMRRCSAASPSSYTFPDVSTSASFAARSMSAVPSISSSC